MSVPTNIGYMFQFNKKGNHVTKQESLIVYIQCIK